MNKIWTRKRRQPPAAGGSAQHAPASTNLSAIHSVSGPLAFALEPRFMFDAAGAATAADAAVKTAADATAEAASGSAESSASDNSSAHEAIAGVTDVRSADSSLLGGRQEVAFVLDNVADYQQLVDGLADGVAVVVIDSHTDALAAMASWLEQNQGYDAVHILSHGSEGQLSLGTTTLNLSTLQDNAGTLTDLGGTLSSNADIMLYGCDVSTDAGMSFVNALSLITGADIAASDDATGDATRGGDWVLETRIGTIDTDIAVKSGTQSAYTGLLVTPSSQDFEGENLSGISLTNGSYYVMGSTTNNGTSMSWSDSHGLTYTMTNSQADTNGWVMYITSKAAFGDMTGTDGSTFGEYSFGIDTSTYQSGATQVFDYLTIGSTDGSAFSLSKFYLNLTASPGATGATVSTIITGYLDGVAVSGATKTVSVATTNNTNANWTWNLTKIDVSSIAAFGNIDAFRITTESGDNYQVILDGINIGAAVASNAAPTITSGGSAILTATDEDTPNVGSSVASILTDLSYADTDGTTNKGIAIYGTTGDGTWQYSTDSGDNWVSVGSVSASSALLLDATALVRYSPGGENSETATLSVKGWDKTSGSAGSKVVVSTSGGSTAFSSEVGTVSVAVSAVNDAPTLGGASVSMGSVNEGATSSGALLSSLLTSLGYSDVDTGAVRGVAITATSGAGTWQYSTDNVSWVNVGSVSASAAVLLTSSTYVRFISTGDNGETAALTVRGWDQSSGTASDNSNVRTGNTSSNGGATAYSSSTANLNLTVNGVNDAPTLSNGATVSLATTDEDTQSTGTSVSVILAGSGYADVDTSSSSGIAITGLTGSGTWKYTTNGTNWYSVGTVSSSTALLLASTAQIRYQPDGITAETATLTFKAWDQTSGSATAGNLRSTASTANSGGTYAFSTNSASASIVVSALNDAPTITSGHTTTMTGTNEDTTSAAQSISAMLTAAGLADVDSGAVSGIAVTGVTGNGTWQFSINGSIWTNFGTVSETSALLLTSSSSFRYVPDSSNGETATLTYKAWDQTSGTASSDGSASTANTTSSGGTSAFSTNSASASITVSSVNDAPVVIGLVTTSPINDNSGANALFGGVMVGDIDTGATVTVTVTVNTATAGTLSGGGFQSQGGGVYTLTGVSAAAATTALDSLAFTPTNNAASSGSTSTTFTIAVSDGTASTSSTSSALTINRINDAPDIGTLTPSIGATPYNVVKSAQISAWLNATDNDTGDSVGIAISAVAEAAGGGTGVWAYSTDGGVSWTDISSVSASSSLLLRSTDYLRYTSGGAGEETNSATVTYRTWDGTAGTAGGTADTNSNGGSSAFSSTSTTASLAITDLNHAPTITSGATYTLTGITEDGTSSGVTSLSILTASGYADSDSGALSGLAITGATGNGTWQYSTDGTTWTSFGTVSASSALLLTSTTQVRYVGDTQNAETATFTYKAWDQSAGNASANGTARYGDASTHGGEAAYSSENGTASIAVSALNDAPTVTNGASTTLTSVDEDTTSSAKTVSALLTAIGANDVDHSASLGVAVTATTGNGTWQYSLNGTTWSNFGTVSTSSALLLDANSSVRYVPDGANGETATISFKAWDQTSGSASTAGAPQTGNASSTGGAFAYSTGTGSLSLTVTSANDAPVMIATTTLTSPSITEDQTSVAGTVSNLLSVIDVDTGAAAAGIAVTNVVGNGTLQYSTDGGFTWVAVGTVSESSALLLGPTAQLRYVADGQNAETATFTYRAWDQSSGTQGTKVDASTNGGTSAFSLATRTVSQAVTAVNDAPTVTSGATATLTATDEDITSGSTSVSSLLTSAGAADVDTGASALGVAITGVTGNGTWQFSTDGTTWTSFGTVSSASSLLLSNSSMVRYVPDGANGETATFTYRSWDTTSGTASTNGSASKVSTATTGGASAFSTNTATASLTVTSVNDAPVMTVTTTITPTSITEDDTSAAMTVSSLLSGVDVDTGSTMGIALTGLSGSGSVQYSLDGGANWLSVGTVSTTSALLLGPTAQIRFVGDSIDAGTATLTYRAWDQTRGGEGGRSNTTNTGGSSAFSAETRTIQQTFTAVNDAPTVNTAILSPLDVTFGQNATFVLPETTFSDVDSTLTYSATLVGGDPLPSWVTFDPTTRTLSVTGSTVANLQIAFVASDGGATTATSTMHLTVNVPVVTTAVAPTRSVAGPTVAQPLFGLPHADTVSTQTVSNLAGNGLTNTDAPISASLQGTPGIFGLSTAQSGPIPTAVTGALGSMSQLDNTGTPVATGLSSAGAGGGLGGGGLGGGLGGSAFGQLGAVGFGGAFDQGTAAIQGLGQGLGTGAGGTAPTDGGAPANTQPTGDGQTGPAPEAPSAQNAAADLPSPVADSVASAIPFNRQLSGLGSGVLGRHGDLLHALDVHTLPSTAA